MPQQLGEKYGWPHRYQCVNCGSHSVIELTGGQRQRIHNKSYPQGGRGNAMSEQDRGKRFSCRVCRARLGRVYDKRSGEAVCSVDGRRR